MTIYDQLRRDEGVRLKPYRCTAGKLTVGVGRNLDDVGITETEAEYLLQGDVCKVLAELKTAGYEGDLTDPRFAALANMAFNLGTQGLLKFQATLAAYRARDWPAMAERMLASLWARQVGPRAVRLAKQVTTGEWQ